MLPGLNFKKTVASCLLFTACTTIYAEDLAAIVNLALDQNTALRQAQETQLATLELLPQARAALLPSFSATANSAYNNSNNPLLLRYNTFSYGATVTQQVVNLSNWFQYKQVDDKIKSAVATFEDTKQDLLLRVSTQYFSILKAQDDLHFAIAERKAFARHLEETQQKFNAGVIAITDVNEAQAKYDGAVAQEITAANEVQNQKEQMGELTGTPAGNISLLKANISLHPPIPADINHWVDVAIKQNYAVQAKNYAIAAAKKGIEQQRAGHYPTLQIDGSTTKAKTSPPSAVKARTNTVSVTLSVPLWAAGKFSSKVRQAQHEYEIALEQAAETQRQSTSNIRQAYRGILTQISQIKALQQSVISSKSALDATQAAFEVGTRTIVDVLNSQSDLLSAKSNLSKARYDYIVASFRLKRFSGLLSVDDINIINSWLEPGAVIPSKNGPVNDADPEPTADAASK